MQGKLKSLYLRYGEDYKRPCIKWATDAMSDKSTDYTASQFFKNITTIR